MHARTHEVMVGVLVIAVMVMGVVVMTVMLAMGVGG